MKIRVHLHGLLRERLPSEAKGRAQLDLAQGATVADLLAHLAIKRQVVVAINDDETRDRSRVLEEGDEITIFAAISGGFTRGIIRGKLIPTSQEN